MTSDDKTFVVVLNILFSLTLHHSVKDDANCKQYLFIWTLSTANHYHKIKFN